MKRSLSILIVLFVTVILSGCIISHSPKEDPVLMSPGDTKVFKMQAFPKPAQYAWYVDGVLMSGQTINSFSYTLDEFLPSQRTIEVRAGLEKHTWNVQSSIAGTWTAYETFKIYECGDCEDIDETTVLIYMFQQAGDQVCFASSENMTGSICGPIIDNHLFMTGTLSYEVEGSTVTFDDTFDLTITSDGKIFGTLYQHGHSCEMPVCTGHYLVSAIKYSN